MPNRTSLKQRVLVIDRSGRIRRDLRAFLENSGPYEVVGEAATLGDAVQVARTTSPQIVLVDVEMAEKDGLSVLRELRMCLPSATAVIATHSDWEEYDEAAQAAGAVSSIRKTRLFTSLMQTLAEVSLPIDRLQAGAGATSSLEKSLQGSGYTGPKSAHSDTRVWWRPRGWREWLTGMSDFVSVLVRGAPVDSSPSRSYWGYVQIAIAFLVSMLAIGIGTGGTDDISDFSKVLILSILLILAGAQLRQIRRLSSAARPLRRMEGFFQNRRCEGELKEGRRN